MGNKISVIVPVYKVEMYLDRCLESIVNQTYKNLEIILVDDGSPDNCPKICDEWAKKDNRIIVIHKENSGVGEARNSGLDVATGDLVGFIDSDDFIDADFYEKLLNSIIENNADLCMCGYKHVYGNKQKLYIEKNLPNINSKTIFKYFFETNVVNTKNTIVSDGIMGSVCRMLIKSSIIKNIRFKKFVIAEDLLFLLTLINDDVKISTVNENLYNYFIRNGSAMHSFNINKINQKYLAFKEILKIVENKLTKNDLDKFKFYNYASLSHEMLKNGQIKLLKEYLKDPFFVSLNTQNGYKEQQRTTEVFKKKVGYFFIHKKLFGLYKILVKLA